VTTPLSAQSPPKKRRTWVIVVVSIALLFAASCLFFMIRLVLNVKGVADRENAAQQATSKFIETSKDGLSQAEYDDLCADAKGEHAFTDLARPEPVTGYQIGDVTVEWARKQATVNVQVTHEGRTTPEVYILQESKDTKGEWHMCAFPTWAS
jgi:hypothetical protein